MIGVFRTDPKVVIFRIQISPAILLICSMSSPSAVADLLAALSYRIQNGNQLSEEEPAESSSSMGLAISELNRSLTLDIGGEDSGVKVLDAALSLMCFKAPQVSIISNLSEF